MHSLLLSWLDLAPESAANETSEVHKKALIEPISMHLKELSASSNCNSGAIIVAYLSNQMETLAGLLQTLRDMEDENRSEDTVSD